MCKQEKRRCRAKSPAAWTRAPFGVISLNTHPRAFSQLLFLHRLLKTQKTSCDTSIREPLPTPGTLCFYVKDINQSTTTPEPLQFQAELFWYLNTKWGERAIFSRNINLTVLGFKHNLSTVNNDKQQLSLFNQYTDWIILGEASSAHSNLLSD